MIDGSDRGKPWPLQFRFSVDIEGVAANLAFLEVTGLDTEAQIIDYRPGNSQSLPDRQVARHRQVRQRDAEERRVPK